jgi:uncharacterized membrane protein YfcA
MNGCTPANVAAIVAASALAGAINAVAGGGTLVSFPALLWAGLSPIVANATSTVGLLPGTAGSIWGYRREVRAARRSLPWVIAPSLAGGAAGALLLLRTPPAIFANLVPFLILGATAVLLFQSRIRARAAAAGAGAGARSPSAGRRWAVAVFQLLIATYGGYFGAGIGILMLATLGLLRLGTIHEANGVKTVATACTNGIAVALFIASGAVDWRVAGIMIAGSSLGGYFGADAARRLGERAVRRIVVAIGLAAAIATGVARFG